MKILAILASAGQARRSNALPPLEVRDVFVVVMQAHTPLVVCLHWRMRHESTDWRSSLLRARRNRTKAWDSVGFRLLLPDQQNASRNGPLLRSRLERISALVLRSTAGGSRHKTKASPEKPCEVPLQAPSLAQMMKSERLHSVRLNGCRSHPEPLESRIAKRSAPSLPAPRLRKGLACAPGKEHLRDDLKD